MGSALRGRYLVVVLIAHNLQALGLRLDLEDQAFGLEVVCVASRVYEPSK